MNHRKTWAAPFVVIVGCGHPQEPTATGPTVGSSSAIADKSVVDAGGAILDAHADVAAGPDAGTPDAGPRWSRLDDCGSLRPDAPRCNPPPPRQYEARATKPLYKDGQRLCFQAEGVGYKDGVERGEQGDFIHDEGHVLHATQFSVRNPLGEHDFVGCLENPFEQLPSKRVRLRKRR